jgi:hypothetical protein
MAQLTIRLRRDPDTGMPDIFVSLRSDEDALPQEHEQQHKRLVESLLGGPIPDADEGRVVVEREKGEPVALG